MSSPLRIDVDVLCERLAASEAAKERYIKKYTTLNENYRALSAHNAKEEQLKEHTVSRWKEDHNALKDCRSELQSKSRELTAVRAECESLRSELGLMRSQLESSEKNNSSTHTRLRESESQRQQTERQNSELTINLDSYRKMRAELTDSLKDKDERLLAAHQMIAEFETQLRQSDEVKRQLELQVEEVTSSARLALQHSQIEVRQRLHIGLEAVQEAERQKAALQDSSDNLARSYHTLRDDFASLEHKLSALQRSKDAADEEIKLQQRELLQVRDEARHSISKSFEDVGQMEKDLRAHYAVKFSNAEAEIEGLRARHAKLSEASRQALEDMQMVIMRNEHEIQSLQQAQEAMHNDRSAVVEAHALTSSRLKDAESQIITLKTHIDASNAEMQSLKGSLAASEADRKALKLTLDQHKDSCMQVIEENSLAASKLAQMHSQAAEARALQQSREARIAHLEKEALLVGSESRRMAEKLSAEIRSLEQKNAELEIQNLSLRRAVEEASSKIIQFFQNEGLRNSLRKTEDMLANAQRKVIDVMGQVHRDVAGIAGQNRESSSDARVRAAVPMPYSSVSSPAIFSADLRGSSSNFGASNGSRTLNWDPASSSQSLWQGSPLARATQWAAGEQRTSSASLLRQDARLLDAVEQKM